MPSVIFHSQAILSLTTSDSNLCDKYYVYNSFLFSDIALGVRVPAPFVNTLFHVIEFLNKFL